MTDEMETELELDQFREQARAWLAENLERRKDAAGAPIPRKPASYYTKEVIDESRKIQKKLFLGGYAGLTWPKQYGGRGLSRAYDNAFLHESAGFVMPDFGVLSNTTFLDCVPTMLAHASPDFLSDFVPRVLAGEVLVCQFFSEPSAGSDLAGIRTRATKDGDNWVLNGQKIWSTFAHLADWGFCLARTNWDVPKHKGLTWFAVPCNSPGLSIRQIRQIDEQADFCEDFFDDVIVPDKNRIGEIDEGWTVTQTMLIFERGAARASDNELMSRPGPLVPDIVELARKTGKLQDRVVRQKIARAHVIDFVNKSLQMRIEQQGRLGGFNAGMAAYGKLFRGIFMPVRARLAVEVGGVASMTWPLEDLNGPETSSAYLNARMHSIAGGTNEIQRNGISERVLGLPREPSYDKDKPFNEVLRDAQAWKV
jgi:alkylation response protein AidB-like acyl-CoA dehydrogenase